MSLRLTWKKLLAIACLVALPGCAPWKPWNAKPLFGDNKPRAAAEEPETAETLAAPAKGEQRSPADRPSLGERLGLDFWNRNERRQAEQQAEKAKTPAQPEQVSPRIGDAEELEKAPRLAVRPESPGKADGASDNETTHTASRIASEKPAEASTSPATVRDKPRTGLWAAVQRPQPQSESPSASTEESEEVASSDDRSTPAETVPSAPVKPTIVPPMESTVGDDTQHPSNSPAEVEEETSPAKPAGRASLFASRFSRPQTVAESSPEEPAVETEQPPPRAQLGRPQFGIAPTESAPHIAAPPVTAPPEAAPPVAATPVAVVAEAAAPRNTAFQPRVPVGAGLVASEPEESEPPPAATPAVEANTLESEPAESVTNRSRWTPPSAEEPQLDSLPRRVSPSPSAKIVFNPYKPAAPASPAPATPVDTAMAEERSPAITTETAAQSAPPEQTIKPQIVFEAQPVTTPDAPESTADSSIASTPPAASEPQSDRSVFGNAITVGSPLEGRQAIPIASAEPTAAKEADPPRERATLARAITRSPLKPATVKAVAARSERQVQAVPRGFVRPVPVVIGDPPAPEPEDLAIASAMQRQADQRQRTSDDRAAQSARSAASDTGLGSFVKAAPEPNAELPPILTPEEFARRRAAQQRH